MTYKILDDNQTFAAQVTTPNTIYEIRYDFGLSNATVTIPDNCVLKFNGGKLSNGTIQANNCRIEASLVPIFSNVTFDGNFLNGMTFEIEWFVSNYETFFNVSSTKDAKDELEAAFTSGIRKVHFNNDRFFPIRSTVEFTGNLDISGVRRQMDAGHNWFLREPCIYSTEVSTLLIYNFKADYDDSSRTKPRLSVEGVNFCCAKLADGDEENAIVEINNISTTTLWGLYVDVNIVASNGMVSVDENFNYTGLKIRGKSASIAFTDLCGSVASVYKAYDTAIVLKEGDTAHSTADFYFNDIKIWANTNCVKGGVFLGGFPVKNFGSHQLKYHYNTKNNGEAYFEAEVFENFGYIWDTGIRSNTPNGKYCCQYTAKPNSGNLGFFDDRTQKTHCNAEVSEPSDAFYPNLLADSTVKYGRRISGQGGSNNMIEISTESDMGISTMTSITSYSAKQTDNDPDIIDNTGLALLTFKRYLFPKRLSRWDSTRYPNSLHSDMGYSFNMQQANYEYQYDVDITLDRNNGALGQYQDNPPIYICPPRYYEYNAGGDLVERQQLYYYIDILYYEGIDLVKSIRIDQTNFNAYRFGSYIRITETFLSNNQNAITIVQYRQRLSGASILSRPMFFIPDYHATDIIRAGDDIDMVDMTLTDMGEMFYHVTHGQLWWNGSRWVERDGASAGVRRSGTFTQKPADNAIYVGFRYFCTSGATVQGISMQNIEIFYTGSGWVDAMGHAVS